jgi:hypothetical protein
VDADRISEGDWVSRLGGKVLPYFEQQQKNLHPSTKGRFEFWGTSVLVKPMEIKKGNQIKLKTKGDSIFVDTCSKVVETAKNYSGEVKEHQQEFA